MQKANNFIKRFLFLFIICLISFSVSAQIRIEAFFGNNEPVADVFWVKPVKEQSPFLYLSRNKFWLPDYNSVNPRFSALQILSYQINQTGLGIALAATATNAEFQGRAGLQFLKVKPKEWMFYTIASTKLGKDGDFRSLIIAQYTPKISKNWSSFNRVEWVSAIGYNDQHRFSQGILKIGVQIKEWQFGPGAELLWLGNSFSSIQQNWGFFLAKNL